MSRSQQLKLGALVVLLLAGGVLWFREIKKHKKVKSPRHAAAGPGDFAAELAKKPLRVLFVGNSYTIFNELPTMVRHLAAAGDNPLRLEAVSECGFGWSLKEHIDSGKPQALLKESQFDWMVLQDFSLTPAAPATQLENSMYPNVTQLQAAAEKAQTQTLLFMTWAREHGDEMDKNDSFEAMQQRITTAYETIAGRLNAKVAPVGLAWQNALKLPHLPKLYREDGSHPDVAGTYLSACVFYQFLFNKSPVGNTYLGGLKQEEALALQKVAAETMAQYKQPVGNGKKE